MVEVDAGLDRCGVDSAQHRLALARQVTELPGLHDLDPDAAQKGGARV